jgi:hypothetical protein
MGCDNYMEADVSGTDNEIDQDAELETECNDIVGGIVLQDSTVISNA